MMHSNVPALVAASVLLAASNVAQAETASDVKCTGCVGSPDILDFGVKTKDLGEGAVTAPKINHGAVNWQKLASELQARILQLEAAVAALEDALATNTVLNLDGYLHLDTTDPETPTARFTGVNVQVVNGLGATNSVNGVGNVIIGYDESYENDSFYDTAICSHGFYQTQEECEMADEVWALEHKSGSHNLVIGPGHRYSQFGGLIAGELNGANRHSASVTAGSENLASGFGASITGGTRNKAIGTKSVVSGGIMNVAGAFTYIDESKVIDGFYSVVGGGSLNVAGGDTTVVSGGYDNFACAYDSVIVGGSDNSNNCEDAIGSVVVGGTDNRTTSYDSVVTGGEGNTARGRGAVVSGGLEREATGDHDWVAGELFQDQ